MCVIGNPPYSVSSSNKGEWILNLIADYKKDLNERKINLDDDYIKFIRYGQHFIDRNGSGVLAYISNNSFIDGITHRQMRKHLLESFDKIYILDLHGNAKKQEKASDGSKDENVFDIMQGVSINIFVKTTNKRKDLSISYFSVSGRREAKYNFLLNSNVKDIKWSLIEAVEPYCFFVPKDFSFSKNYELGFSIEDLYLSKNNGVQTDRDELFIDIRMDELEERMKILLSERMELGFIKKYRVEDSSSFKITARIKAKQFLKSTIKTINYRPFDNRYIYYDNTIISRPAYSVVKNLLNNDNYNMVVCRQQSTFDFQHIFITKGMSEGNSISLQTRERTTQFPLYLSPDTTTDGLFAQQHRQPNLNMDIVQQIAKGLGLAFVPEREGGSGVCFANQHEDLQDAYKQSFAPIDLLDYIYAVLHSPSYRERYKEFLKIDFPRVPYPTDADKFWQLVRLGGELRQLHLLESPKVEQYLTQYPVDGDNRVTKPRYEAGRVYINDTQYFANVPQSAWEFYIGGYQPAQKWLKDRKERVLGFEEILHYQKIIVALAETGRVMGEVDGVGVNDSLVA